MPENSIFVSRSLQYSAVAAAALKVPDYSIFLLKSLEYSTVAAVALKVPDKAYFCLKLFSIVPWQLLL